ncbi:PepSY domain-containing protein [Candidatus Saccharibacteria bacterium]|nr:PepSY domain-containing protein [Candidatus Saccharibacteria bacterium]
MKKEAKKTKKSSFDYSKAIGIGLGAIGIVIIALLSVVIAKEMRDDKKYVISYRSDDKLAEEIVDKSEFDANIVTDKNSNSIDTSKYIAVEKALDVALNNAGLTRENVWDIDVELERKFGQMVFEVTFDAGQYEYEYYINAESGEIVKSFKEIDRF